MKIWRTETEKDYEDEREVLKAHSLLDKKHTVTTCPTKKLNIF